LLPCLPGLESDFDAWRIGQIYRKSPTNYGELMTGKVDALLDEKLEKMRQDIYLLLLAKSITVDLDSNDLYHAVINKNIRHTFEPAFELNEIKGC
jgi:hypothetical protein